MMTLPKHLWVELSQVAQTTMASGKKKMDPIIDNFTLFEKPITAILSGTSPYNNGLTHTN